MSANHGTSPSSEDDEPPQAVVIGFWKLVLLAKLIVIAIGLGLVVAIATEYTLPGLALVLVGSLVAIRWTSTYRHLRREHDLG